MKIHLPAIAVGAMLCASSLAAQAPIGPEIILPHGPIQGAERDANGVLSFKGVPYAAPPVGDLRWRAPQPVTSWTEPREATQYGPACWSALLEAPFPLPTNQSEDCLTLNVWTGAISADEKRPVMVWIHGGGFQFGTSGEPRHDGTRLAQKGVVVVTLNYRLGVFGFMAHPELDAEGTPSGNYGLQDQIAALAWVRDNIAVFGGDPENITVFGESAGSHAIGLLMASPEAAGSFDKAIGMSGAYWDSEHGSLSTYQEVRARGEAFLDTMGAGSIADMRAMDARALRDAMPWDFTMDPGVTVFSPSIDGYIIPRTPAQVFASGAQNDVPLLAGWVAFEGAPFMVRALPHDSAERYRDAGAGVFGEASEEFLALYPGSTAEEAAQSAADLVGDLVISQQTWEWAHEQSRTGNAPVYAYRFGHTSDYLPVATHAQDIPFAFGTLPIEAGDSDQAVSDLMMSYFVNFASDGDPNASGLPQWPKYDPASPQILVLTSETTAEPLDTSRFEFIKGLRTDGALPASWRTQPADRD